MTIDGEPDWNLIGERLGSVIDQLEVAAGVALTHGRYRPSLAALAAQVAGLRTAVQDLTRRQIAVHAIADEAYRQALGLPSQPPKVRPHLTLIPGGDSPMET